MSSPNLRIKLKNKREEDDRSLTTYYENDLPDYPGWTFLLQSVLKRYGVCPFLNVNDEECKKRRVAWLDEQEDNGTFYHDTVKYLTDEKVLEDLKDDVKSAKTSLDNHVRARLSESVLPDDFTIEMLLENINNRKTKSQNQQAKGGWKKTVGIIEFIALSKGFDFTKYVQTVHNVSLQRFKIPEVTDSEKIDHKFAELYKNCKSLSASLEKLISAREKEKIDAERDLAELIKNDFKIEQTGRYFKKWSLLTEDKKEERIKSFCEWFMRQNKKPIGDADKMKKWILEKLESKELRVMDLKWDNKLGYITSVAAEIGENGEFNLCKRAPRVLKVRKQSKKKKDELFQSESEKDLLKRANRLLMYEILKSQSLNKELVVNLVQNDLCTKLVPKYQLVDYLSTKFDEMVTLIKANPLHVH